MLRRIQHIHRVAALNLLLELQAAALLLLIPYRSNNPSTGPVFSSGLTVPPPPSSVTSCTAAPCRRLR